jgi:acetolactate synthase-1/2/3 large subunit
MKLNIAFAALVASMAVVAPTAVSGFVGSSGNAAAFVSTSSFKDASTSSSSIHHHPTIGNVGRRKIKAWHKLELEPWCGLHMSATVDADAKLELDAQEGSDRSSSVNGANGVKASDILAADLLDHGDDHDGDKNGDGHSGDADHAISPATLETQAETVREQTKRYLSTFEGNSGAAVIYGKLVEHGVTVVNGYSGGAVLPLLDQFHSEHPRHPSGVPIRWITNSNESSAGHVAEGIAKSSCEADGKLAAGVVVATSGPGVTNLITPLQDAICDGVPLVVLCGQAATSAPEAAFQFAPAVDLTKPCTKWSYQIKSAVELPMVMDYAFHIAREGRPGPVFIDLPKDLQTQIVSKELIDQYVNNELQFQSFKESTKGSQGTDANPHLVSLQPMYDREAGTQDVAIQIGYGTQNLPFKVGPLKLEPVTNNFSSGKADAFRLDHTPSHKIFKAGSWKDTELEVDAGATYDSPTMVEMMELIQNAQKPIILAGNGANDASAELLELAETLQIPVCSTLHALGSFDERHPLALNMVGMHGHPTPNFMMQECDLVINVGSRFDDRITGNPAAFLPVAKKAASLGKGGVIHVDLRKSEHSKQVEANYFVHSTGKEFLSQVVNYLRKEKSDSPTGTIQTTNTKPWVNRMTLLQEEFPVRIPKFIPEQILDEETQQEVTRTRISAQLAVQTMNQMILNAPNNLMNNCLFTTGVGIHQMVAAQLITWTQPRQMLSSGSLGTMGVALGYVTGAKLANPNKMCIAVDGDGSFNMTFTELKTVAEHKIPIKIIILDNECQMMVEYWQRLFFDGRYIAVHNQQNPEYTKLADAFGIKSIYCDCEEELEEKMKEFLFDDPEEPVLFHCRIERTPCLPLVAPGQALDSMILVDDQCQEVDRCAAPS